MNARENTFLLLFARSDCTVPPRGLKRKKKRLNKDENAVACYLQKVSTYKQVEIKKIC